MPYYGVLTPFLTPKGILAYFHSEGKAIKQPSGRNHWQYYFRKLQFFSCAAWKSTKKGSDAPPSTPIDALTLDRIIVKYTRMLYDDIEKRKGFEKAMQELERRFGITWQEM